MERSTEVMAKNHYAVTGQRISLLFWIWRSRNPSRNFCLIWLIQWFNSNICQIFGLTICHW